MGLFGSPDKPLGCHTMMKKPLYLSVFGLSLSTINELKTILCNLLEAYYQLHWTHLADQKLQLLLMSSDFYEPQLLNKINLQQTKILKLKKNAITSNSTIIDDTLSLPIFEVNTLKSWLEMHFPEMLHETAIQINEQPAVQSVVSIDWMILKCLSSQIQQLPHHGKFVIQQNEQIIALIDLDTYRLYLNSVPLQNADFSLQLASLNQVVEYHKYHQSHDLKHGLWLMFFNVQYNHPPIFSTPLQLTTWPQIPAHPQRRDLFRLSGLFAQGACCEAASKHLKLDTTFVQHFLASCVLANFCVKIPENQTLFKTDKTETLLHSNSKLRQLFGKLRNKLGL